MWFAPKLMKTLSIVGTAAMFMVGGSILVHGWPWLGHTLAALAAPLGPFQMVGTTLLDALAGVAAGAIVLLLWTGLQKVWPEKS